MFVRECFLYKQRLYYIPYFLLVFEALLVATFLAEALEEAHAFLQEDFLLHFEICSTAIDQNFSSCPDGQPAFCHK